MNYEPPVPIEFTYDLYLKGVAAGVNPKATSLNDTHDLCPDRHTCIDCPFSVPNENACITDVLAMTDQFTAYYRKALKENPEALL